ncbi:MAG: right-handed parallel beta-helix repeat-containing protein [Caldilinea sp.]
MQRIEDNNGQGAARHSGVWLRIALSVGILIGLWVLWPATPARAQSCTVTVTTTANSGAGSLRQATRDVSSGGTICFDTAGLFSTPQTITLTGTQIAITRSLAISGTGQANLSVSAGFASRVFELSAGYAVTLTGFTIRDGYVDKGAGFSINGNSTNRTQLTLDKMTFYNNVSTNGSGTTSGGGAFYVTGSRSTVRVIASEFYSNTSRGAGGGGIFVQSGGQVTIEQSQIFSNAVSAGPGGGIYMVGSVSSHSALTMTQSSVFSNTAASSGGGIWSNDYSRLTMSDSRLTGNTSGNNGGGFQGGGGITLRGVYVAQNRASNQGGTSTLPIPTIPMVPFCGSTKALFSTTLLSEE